MKRLLLLTNVLVLGLLAVNVYADHPGRNDGPPVAVGRGFHLKTLSNVLDDLEHIAELNEDNPKKHDRREIRQRLDRARAALELLHEDVENAPIARGGGYNPPPPPPPMPIAMSEAEFVQVLAAYRNAYYTSQKYVVLQEVALANYFTVDQVIRVMNETYWASDKVKVAALLHPRTVDKNDWYKVYSALYWESDREELRRLTSGTNGGRPVR